jgi:hypothetical protein
LSPDTPPEDGHPTPLGAFTTLVNTPSKKPDFSGVWGIHHTGEYGIHPTPWRWSPDPPGDGHPTPLEMVTSVVNTIFTSVVNTIFTSVVTISRGVTSEVTRGGHQ